MQRESINFDASYSCRPQLLSSAFVNAKIRREKRDLFENDRSMVSHLVGWEVAYEMRGPQFEYREGQFLERIFKMDRSRLKITQS